VTPTAVSEVVLASLTRAPSEFFTRRRDLVDESGWSAHRRGA